MVYELQDLLSVELKLGFDGGDESGDLLAAFCDGAALLESFEDLGRCVGG